MRVRSIPTILLVALLAACSGGGSVRGTIPSPGGAATLTLSPAPLDLTDVAPVDSITVAGDVPGVSYTPAAQADCTTPNGSIAVAGDGQAQVDQAGVPLMFLVYATGATPPGSCDVVVRGSDGSFGSVSATYGVVVVQTDAPRKLPAVVTAIAGVTPTSATIAKANQIVDVDASGFAGTATATVGSDCTTTSGITVSPKTVGGSGTFVVAPFGQGAVAKTCSLDIADASGDHATVTFTLAIPALSKLTATPAKVQFGCAAGSPSPCLTTGTVALAEPGAATFSISTKPGYKLSCANAFLGPMTMTSGNGYALSTSGPNATVSFYGLLPGSALDCSQIIITDNGDPAQRVTLAVNPTIAAPPPPLGPAVAPPCGGPDPHVAVPNAPHGMYVWNPYNVDGGTYEAQLESKVIGKDPTLCGVSLVVRWSDVETAKGVYDWSIVDDPVTGLAAPYVNAGLTVNLLMAAGPERGQNNPVTPGWVTSASGDDVPVLRCNDQPPAPDYMSPVFERDWFAFIAAAIHHYSYQNSTMAPHVGYMRFAIGFGVEAIPAHFDTGAHADCLGVWQNTPGVDFTYDGWVQHAKNVVNAMGAQSTDKQLMIALNGLDGGASFYDYPNAVTADAASKGIGFGTENLGIANVALPTSTPAACNPQAKIVNLYWCQSFARHVGTVPYEFQTIVASTAPMPGVSSIDLGKALQYGMDNNAQLFELYPQEFLAADVDGFTTPDDQAAHKTALTSASLVLGAHPL